MCSFVFFLQTNQSPLAKKMLVKYMSSRIYAMQAILNRLQILLIFSLFAPLSTSLPGCHVLQYSTLVMGRWIASFPLLLLVRFCNACLTHSPIKKGEWNSPYVSFSHILLLGIEEKDTRPPALTLTLTQAWTQVKVSGRLGEKALQRHENGVETLYGSILYIFGKIVAISDF